MSERRKIPSGIVVFVIFIVILDFLYFYLLGDAMISGTIDLTTILSVSLRSLMIWIDVLLAVLSLVLIPYGFSTAKNWSRIFALIVLTWALFRSIVYISMTGEKILGFVFFVLLFISLLYLLMSGVKRYFGKSSIPLAHSEEPKEYSYGLYTLYSEFVKLRNGKTQLIFFFSKRTPKSGNPSTFPEGYQVEVSKRSGLPYLKKRESGSHPT
jgi:hypothetical protein